MGGLARSRFITARRGRRISGRHTWSPLVANWRSCCRLRSRRAWTAGSPPMWPKATAAAAATPAGRSFSLAIRPSTAWASRPSRYAPGSPPTAAGTWIVEPAEVLIARDGRNWLMPAAIEQNEEQEKEG